VYVKIDESFDNPPSSLLHLDETLGENELVEECIRLLGQMEARIERYENAARRGNTGVRLFFATRGLTEIESIGTTFRQRWTALRILTPDPPVEIRRRAEAIVDGILGACSRITIPGDPSISDRERLHHLLGLVTREN